MIAIGFRGYTRIKVETKVATTLFAVVVIALMVLICRDKFVRCGNYYRGYYDVTPT